LFTDRKLNVMDGWKSRASFGHAASPSAQPRPHLEQQATLDKSQCMVVGYSIADLGTQDPGLFTRQKDRKS
jgi:hypothetical protein